MNSIKYKLEINDDGFITVVKQSTDSVNNLDKAIDKTGKEGSKSFGSMVTSIRDVTLAFNGAFQMIGTVFNQMKEFTVASNAQIEATKTLTEDQIAYSKELENQTGINDTIISQAQTQLKVMGLNNDRVKEATKYTADLVNQGISLEDAMKKSAAMVTKNYGELGELIPSIKVATTEQEKQSLAMDYFSRISDKSIEKMNGIEGAEIRMANSMTDAKEKFGAVVNDAMIPLMNIATPIVELIGDNMPLAIGVLGTALTAVAIPKIIATTTALWAQAAALTASTGGMNLLVGGIAALAVGGSAAAFASMSQGARESTQSVGSVIDAYRNLQLEELKARQASLGKLWGDRTEGIKKNREELDLLKDSLSDFAKMAGQIGDDARKRLSEAQSALDKSMTNNEETKKQLIAITTEITSREEAARNARKVATDAETVKLIEAQKQRNVQSEALQKQYQDKVAQLGKEGYELERIQAEQANRNTLDNLETMFNEKRITEVAYNESVKSQEQIFLQQIEDLNKKYGELEVAEQKKKNEELIKADEEAVRLQIETREKLNAERLSNDTETHAEVMAMSKELTDKSRTETERRLNDLNLAHTNEVTAKKALFDQLKLSQIEYESWLIESEKKLAADRQAIYAEYSQEIATILGNSFKDLFVFPDNTEALNQLAEEQDELEETHQSRLEAINKEMKLTETSNDRKIELMKEKMKLERDYAKQKESIAKREAEIDKDLSDKFIDNTKTAIKAAIDMLAARGAAAAFASALESVPFPFNLVAAPIAYTGAYVAISAAKNLFRKGGYTGDGNRDEEAGIVHKEEFVNTAETVDRVGIPALQSLQDGRATIVPITQVSKPDTYTGSVNTVINNRNTTTAVNPDGTYIDTNRDVVVINNSDFVAVSRAVENKRNSNRSVLSNRRINEI